MRVDLKLSTIYIFTRDHTSLMTRDKLHQSDSRYLGLRYLFFLVAKQSLSENLISTERDSTQRRAIQSQS